MTFDEYQMGVMKTWNLEQPARDQTINGALGITGEAGEFADLIKKEIFHGEVFDPAKKLKELGDVMYYLTICAYRAGYTLEEVAVANNKKLAARYPDGFVKGGGQRDDR